MRYDCCARREAFRLDSADKPYYAYTDATGVSGYDITLATAASSTSSSWTTSILSTPANPFPLKVVSTDYYGSFAKLALDETTPATHTAYVAKRADETAVLFSDDGTGPYDTDIAVGTHTLIGYSKNDIALDANGNPMVAGLFVDSSAIYGELAEGAVQVAFFDYVTSTYTVSTVTTVPDVRCVGWYYSADHIDLEVDGQGRPVVLVARVDDALAITSTDLEYYVYDGSVWTGGVIMTIPSTTWVQSPDLVFDESGRAFIAYAARVGTATYEDVYFITDITTTTVPNVVNTNQANAEAAIVAAGLTVGTVTTTCDNSIIIGNVINQNPDASTSQPLGTAIDLVVSTGPCPPPLVGWEDWEVVDNISGDLSQVAMDVRQGMVAISYLKPPAPTGGGSQLLYSEYIYSSKYGKILTIQDEPIPDAVATWGTNICGIALDNWNRAYIAVIPEVDGTVARTLKRQSPEIYIINDAQIFGGRAYASLGTTHESFVLDSNDDLHFVWATEEPGYQQIIHAEKPDWKMNPDTDDWGEIIGPWVRTVMVTTDALDFVRPAVTTDSAGNPKISYLDNNSGSSIFYTPDFGTTTYVTGYSGVGTPGSRHDIELGSDGYVRIAHMDLSAGGGIVMDKDYSGDGSFWYRTVAISGIDARNYGWYGTAPYLDLELNGSGNMVMVVAHLDDYDLGDSAKTIVEYHRYAMGHWTKFTIGTFNTGANFVSGLDLEFDENGKPFILIVTKQSPTGDYNALIRTTVFPGAEYCGDHYTPYLSGDYNEDCVVDTDDLLSMAQDWLKCTDPADGNCIDPGIKPVATDGFPPIMEMDGQPHFPIGWYCGWTAIDPNEDANEAELNQNAIDFLTEVANTGANFVMPYELGPGKTLHVTAFLEAGLVTDVRTMMDLHGSSSVASLVTFCQPYDSLFGWYTADEPEAWNMAPVTLQARYDEIKTYDTGNHPVVVTHHGFWYGCTPYLWPRRHADIMATDNYPVYAIEYGGPYWEVSQNAKYHSKITQLHKLGPHMPVPQAYSKGRLPTYGEMRYLTYGPTVYGARGLLYFVWGAAADGITLPPGGWETFRDTVMTPVIGEINVLAPAIMSNSTVVTVTSDHDTDTTGHIIEDMGYLFAQDDNYGYLITANNTKSTYSAQLYLEGPGLLEAVGSGSASVPVMFESRNVSMTETSPGHWTISDSFGPFGVHVYQLYAVPPAQQCGDLATTYPERDLDNNCYVNFADFAMLAGNWFKCSDPADNDCD